MEESPYSIPNSIPPSLVVFSQSGYGDPIRMQRPFSSQVSDGKDGLSGLPNLSPSTFGLRPLDAFPSLPAQLVHLQNPFLHPALESHRLQFGSSTGAFRPIVTTTSSASTISTHSNNNNNNNHNQSGDGGAHNGPGNVKGIPSAFSAPALSTSSRRKLDSIVESVMESRSREQQQTGPTGSASSSSASGAINLEKGYINGQGGGHHPHHPQQQHRHRSISPVNSNSSPPQHHQSHHRHHHHQQQHMSAHGRKEDRDGGEQDERDENMTPNSELTDRSTPEDLTPPPANQQQQQSSKRRRKGNGCDGLACPVCKMSLRPHDLEAHLLAEVEQLMCMSRLRRQQHLSRDEASASSSADSPSGSMKKDGGGLEISHDSRWETYHRIRANRHSRLRIKTRRRREESGGGSHVTCPVCQVPLQGSNEQFSAHVEACLRKNGDVLDEDEPVDIEGDGDTNDMDEYNWIHGRRVNSRNNSAMAINMTTNSRRRDEDSDMLEVVVDGDETSTYGQAQYTEADIKAAAAMTTSSSESNSQKDSKSRWGDNDEAGGEDLSTSASGSLNNHDNGNGGSNLVHVLKSKIQDLEQKLKGGISANCLVCMDKYKKPVVSVSCWHVHCEHCWLKSLFTQKLCPQCNTITSASDLRRIFL